VEWLSGKPVEPASSAQGVGFLAGCLASGCCLSQPGRAPVVPHGAGTRQGLMGGVGSGRPTHGWSSAGPERQWVRGEGRVSR
jgi:hypothetical protein